MDLRSLIHRLAQVSETPGLDARLLIEAANNNLQLLNTFIKRRLNNEPVSKIIGTRGFWKQDFYVTCDVLDPRPDSETLIETVLRFYPDKKQKIHFLDIGTGSGCLLASLLQEYQNAVGMGIDISLEALKVAKKNLMPFKDRFSLTQDDFMVPDFAKNLGIFDVIVSNPPYIKRDDIHTLSPEVRLYDPHTALDGGIDGLSAYRSLAKKIAPLLMPKGHIFFEIGLGQADSVETIMQKNNFTPIARQCDLGGIERVLVFKKNYRSDNR